MPTPRLTALIIAPILALSGCAKPNGPPIVLRKRPPVTHVSKPAGPAKPPTATAAPDETVPLSQSEKEELFRAFDSYLNRAAPQP